MIKESKQDLKVLSVDGGASVNNYLMQFQADILNTTIRVPKVCKTTSLGVCYLAGLHVGFFPSIRTITDSEYTGHTNLKWLKRTEDKCWLESGTGRPYF